MIEYRPVRFLIRLTITMLAVTALVACHYRKGLTLEEAWNELLASMVPETKRSQSVVVKPSAVKAPPHTRRTTEPPPRATVLSLHQDSDLVGQLYVVTATNEDTLFDIARRYNLGISEIESANPTVDRWLPRRGTKVVLPNRYVLPDAPREGIVLNLASMRLFYYPRIQEGESPVVISYPVGIGRQEWQTPKGLAKITQKRANPFWTVPQSIRAEHAAAGDPLPAVVPAGPNNPLGAYAMRLSMPGYLIHGTNKPDGVGMRISHGCVRLYPEDIEALFGKTPVGTPVRIIHQPYLAGWDRGTLYFEAFAPLEEENRLAEKSSERLRAVIEKAGSEVSGDPPNVDWERVEQLAHTPYGIPVPIVSGAPGLDEMIAGLPVYHTPDRHPERVALVEQQPAPPLESQVKSDTELARRPTPQSEPKPEAPRGRQETTPASGDNETRWYVQVGSFKNQLNAEKLAMKIRTDLGFKTSENNSSPSGLHRVLAGPFETRSEAEQGAALIESSVGGRTLILAADRL